MTLDYSGWYTPQEVLPGSVELAMIALSADSESREVVLPPAEGLCRWHSGYRALEDMGYYDYIARIAQTLEIKLSACETGEKVPSIAEACANQLERIYIPVSRRLLVRGIEGYSFAKDVHFLWKRLTNALGMTEATVRAKWEKNGECYNPWCSQRDDASVKMKWCKRCFAVTYCSVACQKAYAFIQLYMHDSVLNRLPGIGTSINGHVKRTRLAVGREQRPESVISGIRTDAHPRSFLTVVYTPRFVPFCGSLLGIFIWPSYSISCQGR